MVDTTIRFADFEHIVFFTGAGMSAESGVPTYRGAGGIWKEYDYGAYACQAAFDRNPDAVWEFHNYRRQLVAKCDPNPGHVRMAELEAQRDGIVVVTQNIDGLHERAGTKRIHRLHGSLWHVRCDACGNRAHKLDAPLANVKCDQCGANWRPDIVWFGDGLVTEVVVAAMQAMQSCDLFVSIGTSAVVFPAAEMPLHAKRAGATLVEVNPDDTPMSQFYDHRLRCSATDALLSMH